ncbi:GGDEF domain-containing protein [Candidatus Woesearchaeota archaeon]|nr:GGDEF domain-containing protein [Candidatus Woesearchaeota archaeon]
MPETIDSRMGNDNNAVVSLTRRDPHSLSKAERMLLGKWLERASSDDEEFEKYGSMGHIHDKKTGAFNSDYFENVVKKEFDAYAKSGNAVSVLYIDIDHFKKFNDTASHEAGDKVLAETREVLEEDISDKTKRILEKYTRHENIGDFDKREFDRVEDKDDLVSRFDGKVNRPGGEEYIIFLRSKLPGAEGVAERLRAAVEKHAFRYKGQNLHVTISVGVTQYNPQGESITDAINRADKAMYHSKENGRNLVSSIEYGEELLPNQLPRTREPKKISFYIPDYIRSLRTNLMHLVQVVMP